MSQENARLSNECGANCTTEDFRRIDQQMAQLERAGTLAEIGKRSTLTSEQARQMAQLAVELAPLYGTGESLVQMITGKSTVTGEEASRFWAAVGVVPVAGGVLKKVGEPAVDGLAAVFKAGETAKGPIWSSTKTLSSIDNALGHWSKHKAEFPELSSSDQYIEAANSLATRPPADVLTKTRGAETLIYDRSTNTFLVRGSDGAPKTMFRPADGINYWNKQ